MDADHRGGWTQVFGGKTSEPETSQSLEIYWSKITDLNLTVL